MSGLFLNMIKEEWRIHSTMFGSLNFALFPVLICAIGFMGTFLIPLIQNTLTLTDLVILIHANYLMLGLMVGAFGLLGNEVMNRRFGQASLLAYSARTLPLTPRYIFLTFVLKDTLYYFFLWILPLGAGFFIASLVIGIDLMIPLRLLVTLTFSFLSGMSCIFFLSTVYERSARLLGIILVLSGLIGSFYTIYYGINPASLFPALLLFTTFNVKNLFLTLLTLIIPFIAALLLYSPDTRNTTKIYENKMKPLIHRLRFIPYPSLMVKDMLDLWRSGSIIGQVIFSFFVPLVVIWFFLSLLDEYISILQLLFTFAMITGIIASTMYTWITMFDSLSIYTVLPVDVPVVIKSKITLFSLLQVIPALFISGICLFAGEGAYLFPVLVLTLSVSFYVLAVMIWLTGLSPSVLVYSARVMVLYFLLIGLILAIFSSLTMINPWSGIGAVLLFIPAYEFIKLGFRRWDRVEQGIF
ncbi:MAG: hypothetical protein GXY48_00625 [Methanomicrobiales archaeon]|nr:hypothetical protein [Methanomicrobiales archaeon]